MRKILSLTLIRSTALATALLGAVVTAGAAELAAKPAGGLYLGADLSYVNEMEDCGAVFRKDGQPTDPFTLMKAEGGNIVRVRLWNNPTWTKYSNIQDVTKTIRRAKAAGMQVLLDFHYSDDWADGDKQIVPAEWSSLDLDGQVKALHAFTYDTLMALDAQGLMPEMVQVGNETNPEMMGGVKNQTINWSRNAALFNAGIQAVREAGAKASINPRIMLHIAQPENVEPWFAAAKAAGVTDFDIIGISYYRKWSTQNLKQLGETIARLRATYPADVVIAETAYPFSDGYGDNSPNLLGSDSALPGYPATPKGQLNYMIDLTQLVVDKGGAGVVYWEPAWVSTQCKTRWGVGSNWENAAWFDLKRHEALPVFRFLAHPYKKP